MDARSGLTFLCWVVVGLSKIDRAAPKMGLKGTNSIIITCIYSNVMAKSITLQII